MESDGGDRDDTKRVTHGRTSAANEGVASFGGAQDIAFGSDKQQDETVLAKWAHKERTLNGTVSFQAHQEDEPSVFSSRANLIDIEFEKRSHEGAIQVMPTGIQQEKNVTAVSGRSGFTDVAKIGANIDQGANKIAET